MVAARPDVGADAHLCLVADKAWQVGFALAENAHADPAVWRALTRAPDADTRHVFAGNQWLPEDIAWLLAEDPMKDVRAVLAYRTPYRKVLASLLADAHPDVRCSGLDNPLVSAEQVQCAAHDRQAVVRAAAAGHRLLPMTERQRLAADRSEFVRSEAAASLLLVVRHSNAS